MGKILHSKKNTKKRKKKQQQSYQQQWQENGSSISMTKSHHLNMGIPRNEQILCLAFNEVKYRNCWKKISISINETQWICEGSLTDVTDIELQTLQVSIISIFTNFGFTITDCHCVYSDIYQQYPTAKGAKS